MKQLHHIKLFLVFLIIFVQLFTPIAQVTPIAQATDTIVDDAPPVDENKPYIPVTADNLNDMTAEAAILIDARTGRILYEKNPDKKLMPASTTKMMTCILGLENSNDDDIVNVDNRAVGVDGSAIYLNEGDQIKMSELLQATMLASGNDGATAVGYYVGQGSMENFVQMMNDKAKSIGAENTHFNNPHGLTDPNHYTTARDLAKIAAYGYKNPKFR
ncbi:D-alanyl-D-alanine carboxypeptidase family protein, partial [Megamonas hypermegale]